MSVLCPITEGRFQRLVRLGVLALVCTLGGAIDVLNNSVALMAARMASFPEEEEHHTAKDRGTLVAAAQPPRKGGLRPVAEADSGSHLRPGPAARPEPRPAATSTHRPLIGAGIFQHC